MPALHAREWARPDFHNCVPLDTVRHRGGKQSHAPRQTPERASRLRGSAVRRPARPAAGTDLVYCSLWIGRRPAGATPPIRQPLGLSKSAWASAMQACPVVVLRGVLRGRILGPMAVVLAWLGTATPLAGADEAAAGAVEAEVRVPPAPPRRAYIQYGVAFTVEGVAHPGPTIPTRASPQTRAAERTLVLRSRRPPCDRRRLIQKL